MSYNMKNKNLKNYITIIMIIIILSISIFNGCSKKENPKGEVGKPNKDIHYNSALVEKNNNIYIYDDKYTDLEAIGDLTRLKEFTTLSGDWKNIAFKYVDDKDKINIYNLESREYKNFEIENSNIGEVSGIYWIDNLIVIGLYKNPTTTKYLIYDDENFELVNSCEGILIDIFDGGKTLVYGATNKGSTSIYVDDKKIYTLENDGEVLLSGNVSSNKKDIAFITFVFDRETLEQKEYLYEGTLEENEIKNIRKVEKPYDIVGDVSYEGEELRITDIDTYVDVKDDKFIINDLKESNESLRINTKKLKGILKETFKTENIDESLSWHQLGIYNITWFTR